MFPEAGDLSGFFECGGDLEVGGVGGVGCSEFDIFYSSQKAITGHENSQNGPECTALRADGSTGTGRSDRPRHVTDVRRLRRAQF